MVSGMDTERFCAGEEWEVDGTDGPYRFEVVAVGRDSRTIKYTDGDHANEEVDVARSSFPAADVDWMRRVLKDR